MKPYTQFFEGLADSLVTDCYLFPAVDFGKGEKISVRYYSDKAAWDTGSESTVIRPALAEYLGLKPIGKALLSGAGGDNEGNLYKIHLGLPNGDLVHNVTVIAAEIPDYDILIGMDIISTCDFAITNKEDKTVFSIDRPSARIIDFTNQTKITK